ncbi:MAG: phosphoenolpyruvate synthase [archaeon]
MIKIPRYVASFEDIDSTKKYLVGGKNANLGELLNKVDVPVPPGYVVTTESYREFLDDNKFVRRIRDKLKELKDPEDTDKLNEVGKDIREMILNGEIPDEIKEEIRKRHKELKEELGKEPEVAVRSSATSEDLKGASFAGQQDTYLNVRGIENILEKIKECFASLYTNRAIYYRERKEFNHLDAALSVAIQKMVKSESSGVLFTLDLRNGDNSTITIEGSWGLGEYIVGGTVTPDTYFVDKETFEIKEKKISTKKKELVNDPRGGTVEKKVSEEKQKAQVLSDGEIKKLAKYSMRIEDHYNFPQDIEWGYDKKQKKLYILQSRPETAWSEKTIITKGKSKGEIIVKGMAASPGIEHGKARIVHDLNELSKVEKGDVLVTKMTNPDMVPAMRRASAIVTNEGGLTSHASIVSRELGISCVVGTENATEKIKEGEVVSVDGTHGEVFRGVVESEKHEEELPVPETKTNIYVNLGVPQIAEEIAKKPVDGVGLMREEFILATHVKEHPLSLIEKGEEQKFIDKLSEGILKVAKAFDPRPVVLRLSDFKTNEYRRLKGGEKYEPKEHNPMIGWRGCSRYISEKFKPAFKLELEAVKKAREEQKNIHLMIPFVRTVKEIKETEELMKEHGLKRSEDLNIWMMAEIPSNVLLIDEFSEYCDGFSIGTNDLTQLTLGADRDSEILAKLGVFDQRDKAVKKSISKIIRKAHKKGKTVSICGQLPSIYPEFSEFLVKEGIDSISVNPDTIERVKRIVAKAEEKVK